MKGWYVSAIRLDVPEAERFPMIACGPFRTRDEAARYVEPVRAKAEETDPVSMLFREVGTAALELETLPEGPGNDVFGLAVLDGYVLTAESLVDAMIGGSQ